MAETFALFTKNHKNPEDFQMEKGFTKPQYFSSNVMSTSELNKCPWSFERACLLVVVL